MSYCRFSTDDHKCDFYAYESDDGFVLHLAGSRVIWDPPNNAYDIDVVMDTPGEEWVEMARVYHEAIMNAPRERIESEYAGKTYTYSTLLGMKNGIEFFIREGFIAPDWLVSSLEEEIYDKENNNRAESANIDN